MEIYIIKYHLIFCFFFMILYIKSDKTFIIKNKESKLSDQG